MLTIGTPLLQESLGVDSLSFWFDLQAISRDSQIPADVIGRMITEMNPNILGLERILIIRFTNNNAWICEHSGLQEVLEAHLKVLLAEYL